MAPSARKLIRWQLHGYDGGWYFVTIRLNLGVPWLSHIHNSKTLLTHVGKKVENALLAVHDPSSGVFLDEYVLMPDHLHAIIFLQQDAQEVPRPDDRVLRSLMRLSRLIGKFKMQVTKEVNISNGTPGERFWQNRFHDRVIRNEKELNAIRNYIRQNPARAKPM